MAIDDDGAVDVPACQKCQDQGTCQQDDRCNMEPTRVSETCPMCQGWQRKRSGIIQPFRTQKITRRLQVLDTELFTLLDFVFDLTVNYAMVLPSLYPRFIVSFVVLTGVPS